jgi:hypothetical protein
MTSSLRPPPTPPTPRSAYILATIGGVLGVLVGTLEVAFGSSIRSWVGDKYDTVGLGLTTIALAALALASATVLRRRPSTPARHFAVAVVVLVSGAICFTTAGRLWWVPGSMICSAGVVTIWSLRRVAASVRNTVVDRWFDVLLFVLGCYLVALGAVSIDPHSWAALLVLGGGLTVTSMAIAHPRLARHQLIAGIALAVTPVVALTWWSIVTPLIALLALVIATVADRRNSECPRTSMHRSNGLDVTSSPARSQEVVRS